MLTLKFFKTISSGGTDSETKTYIKQDVISCVSYEAYERPCGHTTITTFQGMTNASGTERHIGTDTGHFDSCYVENITGKTIARYHAMCQTAHGEHANSL